jgi:hypothetical protein
VSVPRADEPVEGRCVEIQGVPFVMLKSDGGDLLVCKRCLAVSFVAHLQGDARNTSHLDGCEIGAVTVGAGKPILFRIPGEVAN